MKYGKAFLVLIGLLSICLFVFAGELEPPGKPRPTMHTLGEVFDAVNNSNPTAGPIFASDGRWAVALHVPEYPGSWDYEGQPDTSKVIGLDYSYSVPYDKTTGQTTGSKQLDAITVIKNFDKSSPGLAKEIERGQILSTVEIRFLWQNPSTKAIEVYYRLTLKNAKVVKYGQSVVHRGNDVFAHLEEVGFIFESVTMSWEPDHIVEIVTW